MDCSESGAHQSFPSGLPPDPHRDQLPWESRMERGESGGHTHALGLWGNGGGSVRNEQRNGAMFET